MANQRTEYRSSRRSKNAIKKAFARLLHEKDISKISVTDIIRYAEVSRGTFYSHYPDVYGLMEQIENEEISKLMNYVQELGFEKISLNPEKLIRPICEYINNDIEYYRLLFLSKNADRFLIRIKNFLKEQILTNKKIALYYADSTGEASVYITFFTTAISNVFVDWLNGSIDISVNELTSILSRLVIGALRASDFPKAIGLDKKFDF